MFRTRICVSHLQRKAEIGYYFKVLPAKSFSFKSTLVYSIYSDEQSTMGMEKVNEYCDTPGSTARGRLINEGRETVDGGSGRRDADWNAEADGEEGIKLCE